MAGGPMVTLYTRAGCCLCDSVKTVLEQARSEAEFRLEVLDIDADPALRARYNDDVPVVAIDGRKAFKYHLDRKEFLRRLKART